MTITASSTATDAGTQLPTPLTDAEVEQFWEQGYLLVKGVLSPEEVEHYRRVILDLLPRDLTIPERWHAASGRIKPIKANGSHTYDIPDLLPLFANEKLYAVAAQLLQSTKLRSMDGSIGITLRNDTGDHPRSQGLHIDASVPRDIDNFRFTLDEVQVGGCYYFSDVLPNGGGIHVVPGGHRMVEEEARAHPQGRQLHNGWKRIEHLPESVEVTGSAGDFALLHHLMPHGASHNRRPTPRVAQFMRFVREDHPHGAGRRPPEGFYSAEQIAAMSPLGRKLLGVDPW